MTNKHRVTKICAVILAAVMIVSLIVAPGISAEAATGKVKSVKITNLKKNGKYYSKTLKKGKSFKLKTKVSGTASNKKVTYKVISGKKVVKVSKTGKVTAKKNGTAVIKVTSKANKKKYCKVKVKIVTPVSKITLNRTAVTITKSKIMQLTATVFPSTASNKGIIWSSSNTKVATVTSTGKVKAVKSGTAIITAAAKDGSKKTAVCRITVKASGSSESISQNNSIRILDSNVIGTGVAVGESVQLTAPDDIGSNVIWSSSSPYVTVDSNGIVTVNSGAGGTVKITAKGGYGEYTCKITISGLSNSGSDSSGSGTTATDSKASAMDVTKTAVSSIDINTTETEMCIGNQIKVYVITNSDAANCAVNFTSSDESVAAIDADKTYLIYNSNKTTCTLTGVGAGTATITATAADGSGVTASFTVTVYKHDYEPVYGTKTLQMSYPWKEIAQTLCPVEGCGKDITDDPWHAYFCRDGMIHFDDNGLKLDQPVYIYTEHAAEYKTIDIITGEKCSRCGATRAYECEHEWTDYNRTKTTAIRWGDWDYCSRCNIRLSAKGHICSYTEWDEDMGMYVEQPWCGITCSAQLNLDVPTTETVNYGRYCTKCGKVEIAGNYSD